MIVEQMAMSSKLSVTGNPKTGIFFHAENLVFESIFIAVRGNLFLGLSDPDRYDGSGTNDKVR